MLGRTVRPTTIYLHIFILYHLTSLRERLLLESVFGLSINKSAQKDWLGAGYAWSDEMDAKNSKRFHSPAQADAVLIISFGLAFGLRVSPCHLLLAKTFSLFRLYRFRFEWEKSVRAENRYFHLDNCHTYYTYTHTHILCTFYVQYMGTVKRLKLKFFTHLVVSNDDCEWVVTLYRLRPTRSWSTLTLYYYRDNSTIA